jgi:hypothetical protein
MAKDSAPRATARLPLEFADVVVDVESSDSAALEWLAEFLDPWWQLTRRAADWRVRVDVSASRYRAALDARPPRLEARECFLFDQQVLALPAWDASDGTTTVDDTERSLCFTVSAGTVDVVADPATKRWRFPLVWILTEIAATRLRPRSLDLHAAAVDGRGDAVVIAGPKLSGKTSLALYLLARGGRWLGNDRVLLEGIGTSPRVRGVPSAVKIRPETADRFPELAAITPVDRPYLLAEAELDDAPRALCAADAMDLAVTPAQLATRLGVDRVAEAPLGAFLFPEVRADVRGWDAQLLPRDEVITALTGSVYGGRRVPGSTTLFEALAGGTHTATAPPIETAAHAAPGYRILLGPDAYDDGGLAAWILDPELAR